MALTDKGIKKMAKVVNYTPEQEARILASAPVTQAIAAALALEFGKERKSVIAKASRLGVYQKATPVGVFGGAPAKKEAIAQEIAVLCNVNESVMESLVNASKQALVTLRDRLAA